MKSDDIIGLMVISFLAGSLVTMILFGLIDHHLDKRGTDEAKRRAL